MLVDSFCICVRVDSLDEFVESLKIKSQIKIVDKCLLLVSDVDEGSVQGRKQLLYLSEIYISYREAVTLAGLLVQLDKLVVLHQSDRDFC